MKKILDAIRRLTADYPDRTDFFGGLAAASLVVSGRLELGGVFSLKDNPRINANEDGGLSAGREQAVGRPVAIAMPSIPACWANAASLIYKINDFGPAPLPLAPYSSARRASRPPKICVICEICG